MYIYGSDIIFFILVMLCLLGIVVKLDDCQQEPYRQKAIAAKLAWHGDTEQFAGFRFIHRSCQLIPDSGHTIELQIDSTSRGVHSYVSVKGPHSQKIVELNRGHCGISDMIVTH